MKALLFALAAALFALPVAVRADDAKADKKKKKGPDLEAVFTKLDTNKDGKLSKDEFSKVKEEIKKKKEADAAAAAKKPAKAGKKVDALFTKLDVDKDGSLSKDEFKKLTQVMQEMKKDKKK